MARLSSPLEGEGLPRFVHQDIKSSRGNLSPPSWARRIIASSSASDGTWIASVLHVAATGAWKDELGGPKVQEAWADR